MDAPTESVSLNALEVHTIPLSEIQPVTEVPPEWLIEGFQSEGQLEAVVLRDKGNSKLSIIEGRRRIATARHLKWETIEAQRVAETVNDTDALVLSLIYNNSRANNLPHESELVDKLMSPPHNLSPQDIAERAHMPLSNVKKLIRYKQTLAPTVYKAVIKGQIAKGTATKMQQLTQEQQASLMEKTDGKPTLGDATSEVKAHKTGLLTSATDNMPTLNTNEQLAAEVEAAAAKFAGDNRKALIKAATILRE